MNLQNSIPSRTTLMVNIIKKKIKQKTKVRVFIVMTKKAENRVKNGTKGIRRIEQKLLSQAIRMEQQQKKKRIVIPQERQLT